MCAFGAPPARYAPNTKMDAFGAIRRIWCNPSRAAGKLANSRGVVCLTLGPPPPSNWSGLYSPYQQYRSRGVCLRLTMFLLPLTTSWQSSPADVCVREEESIAYALRQNVIQSIIAMAHAGVGADMPSLATCAILAQLEHSAGDMSEMRSLKGRT